MKRTLYGTAMDHNPWKICDPISLTGVPNGHQLFSGSVEIGSVLVLK